MQEGAEEGLWLRQGWLDKQHPRSQFLSPRLLRLSADSLQWFDAAGRRGELSLAALRSVRLAEEDPCALVLEPWEGPALRLRACEGGDARAWQQAVALAATRCPSARAVCSSLSEAEEALSPVAVLRVALLRADGGGAELELAEGRALGWGRVVSVPDMRNEDRLLLRVTGLETRLDADRLRGSLGQGDCCFPLSAAPTPGPAPPTCALVLSVQASPPPPPLRRALTLAAAAALLAVAGAGLGAGLARRWLPLLSGAALSAALLLALPAPPAPLSFRLVLKRVQQDEVRDEEREQGVDDEPYLEHELPARFLAGCDGDRAEAERRWALTFRWRRDERAHEVLHEPLPLFAVARTHMSFYHAGRGRGGLVVYYVRPPDDAGHRLMQAQGVTGEVLWRVWLLVTEFRWRVLVRDEGARSVSVVDLACAGMGGAAGGKLELLRRTVLAANAHYPERSHAVLVVNAPFWFSAVWALLKPLVSEKTLARTRILGQAESLAGLREFIADDQIPALYGGGLSFGPDADSCRHLSPEAQRLDNFVRALNDRAS